MKNKYENLEKPALEKIIHQLQEELEDIEDERTLVLGQTGLHLPGSTVKKYEAEIANIRKQIKTIEDLLKLF